MASRWKRCHLCLYLLGLGFDSRDYDDDVKVGERMFDRLNFRACIVLFHFLFTKLDRSRAEVDFRSCYIPGSSIMNREFRNKCCKWLKDISVKRRRFPKMTPSSLLTPAGPKFINLFYQLARYVMLKDLKAKSVGIYRLFVEAVASRRVDVHMAKARRRVAYIKLQQIFQKDGFVRQEYKQNAQRLIKEIKQIKSEYKALKRKSCNMKQNEENKSYETKKIQKVRSMWTSIMEVLTSLKKEKELVASVLPTLEDQYILDGDVVFKIPRMLIRRVERNVNCCTRDIYEGKNLDFVTLIQLLNEALRVLRDEHCQSELLQLQAIEGMVTLCKKLQETLNAKRLEIEQQHSASARAVSRNHEDWEVKWESFLGLHPVGLISDQDPQLSFLESSPPHCIDLAEEMEEHSILSQHLASASGSDDSVHEVWYEKNDGALETVVDKSTPSPRRSIPSSRLSFMSLDLSDVSENTEVLIEKHLLVKTWEWEKMTMPPKTVKKEKNESSSSEAQDNGGDDVTETEFLLKKEDLLEKARDELVEEVVRVVMSESPQSGEGKGVPLAELVKWMSSDLFLARNEIPQTSDLCTESRRPWRKVIQTEGSSEVQLAPAVIKEAPMDNTPRMKKAADSRFSCPIPASPVPNCDPLLLGKMLQLSSTEFRPQEQIRINDVVDSPVLETSGEQKSEKTEAQELPCIVLKESFLDDADKQTCQYVKQSMDPPAILSEDSNRPSTLLSDPFQGSLADGTLCWNASSLLRAFGHGCLGILEEAFPEDSSIDLNESTRSQCDFDEVDSKCATSSSENKGDTEKPTLNSQSLLNTDKALEKPAAASEEKEFSSCQEVFWFDEQFTKAPSPRSLENRKYSLSSLQVACEGLTEDLMHELKDKEQLDEQLGTKDPSSE